MKNSKKFPGDSRSGTARMEGLIEGPVPPFEDGEKRLRRWADEIQSKGIQFHLSIDGPGFSILTDSTPFTLTGYENLKDRVIDVITSLLNIFPGDIRTSLFSTVRSIEYGENTQVQTLYIITGKGVEARSREVESETYIQPEDHFIFSKRVSILIAGVVFLILLIASFFIVDYGSLWNSFRARYSPVKPGKIPIKSEKLSRYLSVKSLKLDKTQTKFELVLVRSSHFPSTTGAYKEEKKWIEQQGSLDDILAFNMLVATGSLRIQFLDNKDKILEEQKINIRKLLTKPEITVKIPIGENRNLTQIKLAY